MHFKSYLISITEHLHQTFCFGLQPDYISLQTVKGVERNLEKVEIISAHCCVRKYITWICLL